MALRWLQKKTSVAEKSNNAVLQTGQQVGRYIIQKKLSRGGFGVVYVGQRDDGQQVALKEFLPSVIACRTLQNKERS